jgi:hypothetical protein
VRLFSHNFDFGFSKTSSNTANGPSEGAVGEIEEGMVTGEEGNILRAREKGLHDSQGRKKAPEENHWGLCELISTGQVRRFEWPRLQ